jgi:hypothetical protein
MPIVAVGGNGIAAIGWVEGGDVWARVSEHSGQFGGSMQLGAVANGQGASLAVDGQGNVSVAWTHPSGSVWVATRSPGGNFGPVTTLDTHGTSGPQIAYDGAGTLVAAWMTSSGGGGTVYATRPSGGSFSAAQSLGIGSLVRLATGPTGDVIALGSGSGTQAVVRPSGGSFGSVEPVSPGQQRDLAVGPNGTAFSFSRSSGQDYATRGHDCAPPPYFDPKSLVPTAPAPSTPASNTSTAPVQPCASLAGSSSHRRRQRRPSLKRALTIRLQRTGLCRLTIAGSVAIKTKRYQLLPVTVPAGTSTATTRLALPRRSLRKVKAALRHRKMVTATLTITTVDVLGRSSTETQQIRLQG